MSLLDGNHYGSTPVFVLNFDFELTKKRFSFPVVVVDFILIYAINGLHKLHVIIENYLANNDHAPKGRLKSVLWIKSVAKYVSLQAVSGAIGAAIGHFLF